MNLMKSRFFYMNFANLMCVSITAVDINWDNLVYVGNWESVDNDRQESQDENI